MQPGDTLKSPASHLPTPPLLHMGKQLGGRAVQAQAGLWPYLSLQLSSANGDSNYLSG